MQEESDPNLDPRNVQAKFSLVAAIAWLTGIAILLATITRMGRHGILLNSYPTLGFVIRGSRKSAA